MKNLKKMFALCMAFVLMFSLITVAYAEDELRSGDYGYIVVENEVKITNYYGTDTDLQIPSDLGGYKVTYIGENAFKGNSSLNFVSLPDTIYKVENSAFEGCSNLSSVVFGSGTKWVATRAFAECPKLVEIQLPKNIKILGSEAFLGTGITSVCIPKSLIETHYDYKTGNGPFGGTGLTTVEFDNGVSIIGRGMFAGAESLTAIVIPETVTEIADHAFEGTGFVDFVVPDSVVEMGTHVFANCKSLKSVKLSENSENIGAWMFSNSGLESLVVPKSVVDIGGYAFADCANLKSVVMSNYVMSLGGNAFENCTSLEEVVLSNNLLFINDETFLNCTALKELVIPFRVHTMRARALKGCTGLEKLTISRAVGTVEEDIVDWNTTATINTFSGKIAERFNYHKIPFVREEVKAESFEVVSGVPEHIKLYGSYQTVLDIVPLDFTQGVSITSSNEQLLTINDRGKLIANEKNSGDVVVTYQIGSLKEEYNVHVGYYMGDVTLDYKINAQDALSVLKHSAEIEELESSNEKFADINSDDMINAEDALLILKVAAGIDISNEINTNVEE